MFGLRCSSPSITLGNTVIDKAGMGFTLTAPRPKRVVMPIVYYDNIVGTMCGAGDGYTYSSSGGNSGADYAGVFESGCDPVAMRASLQGRTPSSRRFIPTTLHQAVAPPAVDEIESSSSSVMTGGGPCAGASYGGLSDDSSDCLFAMEGPDAGTVMVSSTDAACSDQLYSNNDGRGGLGSGTGYAGGRAMAVNAERGGGGCGGGSNGAPKRGVAAAVIAAGTTPPTTRGLRTRPKPRVIAPGSGRRCSAPGMYRLRLSTSC